MILGSSVGGNLANSWENQSHLSPVCFAFHGHWEFVWMLLIGIEYYPLLADDFMQKMQSLISKL